VFVQGLQRNRAELLRGVRFEEMRASIDDVHRLTMRRIAGEAIGDARVRLVEREQQRVHRVVGNRRVIHRVRTIRQPKPSERTTLTSDA